jgi:hypothetical protein
MPPFFPPAKVQASPLQMNVVLQSSFRYRKDTTRPHYPIWREDTPHTSSLTQRNDACREDTVHLPLDAGNHLFGHVRKILLPHIHPSTSSEDFLHTEISVEAFSEFLLAYLNENSTCTEVQRQNDAKAYYKTPEQHQAHSNRRAELSSDPSALFRHYIEYMELFPLGAGECLDPYLVGLLANQKISDDQEKSERRLPITYAKIHWENEWENE